MNNIKGDLRYCYEWLVKFHIVLNSSKETVYLTELALSFISRPSRILPRPRHW